MQRRGLAASECISSSPRSRSVCDDVSTDWFLWIGSEHGRTIDLSDHLICYHDGNTKLQHDIQKSEIIYFCVAANGWIGTMFVNNC